MIGGFWREIEREMEEEALDREREVEFSRSDQSDVPTEIAVGLTSPISSTSSSRTSSDLRLLLWLMELENVWWRIVTGEKEREKNGGRGEEYGGNKADREIWEVFSCFSEKTVIRIIWFGSDPILIFSDWLEDYINLSYDPFYYLLLFYFGRFFLVCTVVGFFPVVFFSCVIKLNSF